MSGPGLTPGWPPPSQGPSRKRYYIQVELGLDTDEWFNAYGHPINEEQVKMWMTTLLLLGSLKHDVKFKFIMELPNAQAAERSDPQHIQDQPGEAEAPGSSEEG